MKIIWGVETGMLGSERGGEIEIDDDRVEGMTEKEKDKYISDCVWAEVENYVNWYWRVEETP